MQDKTIKVVHPDKRPMPLSESLMNFLAHRQPISKTHPFKLGEWLSVVPDELLLELQKQASDSWYQVSPATSDDAGMVCLQAAMAETARKKWTAQQVTQLVGTLMLACGVERLKRRGMIEIRSVLTIAPGAELDIEIRDEQALTELMKMRGGLNS
jgi:hypothetical protein